MHWLELIIKKKSGLSCPLSKLESIAHYKAKNKPVKPNAYARTLACTCTRTHTPTCNEFKDASLLDDLTLLGRLFQTDSEHKKKISDQVSACTQEEDEE